MQYHKSDNTGHVPQKKPPKPAAVFTDARCEGAEGQPLVREVNLHFHQVWRLWQD